MEASQIFLRDTHILPKLLSYEKNTVDVTGEKNVYMRTYTPQVLFPMDSRDVSDIAPRHPRSTKMT
jgi:hypothetical protein